MKLVKSREAKANLAYQPETGKLHGTWKVPEIEHMSKGLNEANRFFNCFDYQKKYGLKLVTPPIAIETLDQLRGDIKREETPNPNYLINQRFKDLASQEDWKDRSATKLKFAAPDLHLKLAQPHHDDIISLLSERDKRPDQAPSVQHKSALNSTRQKSDSSRRHYIPVKPPMDQRLKENSIKSDSKYARRILKFNEQKGRFSLPKRERFNEEHEEEIQSQICDQREKSIKSHLVSKKFGKKELDTLEGAGSQVVSNKSAATKPASNVASKQGSKISGLTASVQCPGRTLSKTDLKRFFKKDKDEKLEELSRKRYSRSIFKKSQVLPKPDCGNRRYAASKKGSEIGLLIGNPRRRITQPLDQGE